MAATAENVKRSSTVRVLENNPEPPDYERHIQHNIALEQIWKYINPLMLYTRHLGVKARSARLLEALTHDPAAARKLKEEDHSAYEVWQKVEEVKAEFHNSPALRPRAVYRFFRAASRENSIMLFDGPASHGKEIGRFTFGRQAKADGLCLADYVSPLGGSSDNMAMFVVTIGEDVRGIAGALKERGEYLKSHILQALAIESAEAYAELLHGQLRHAWGFPDLPTMTMLERFQAKYRGRRFSFGYPACPRLEDQTLLFELLNPAEIGVQLTDGFMMDPESSVSAIAFHHPDAKYFGVGASETGDGDDSAS